MFKRVLLPLLCVIATSCQGIVDTGLSDGLESNFGPLRYSFGDSIEWADPDYDDSSWAVLDTPGVLGLRGSGGDGYFWLRTTVEIPSDGSEPLWLESGKLDCAFHMYAGGVYAGFRGGFPPNYHVHSKVNSVVLIPSSAITNGYATLAFRCYYSGSQSYISAFRLADADRVDMILNLMSFLVSRVNTIIAVLCIFMGCYFLAGFLARPGDRASLYYAISLFLVSCYFLAMGSERVMLGGPWQNAVARSCLVASLAFTLLFFITYFNSRGFKAATIFAIIDIVVFSAAYSFFVNNDAVTNLIFNLSLLPIFGIIVIVITIVIKAFLRGQKDALAILIGLGLGVGFSIHDILFQLLGHQPFAWLQGFTFFSLNLSIFIAISIRTSIMHIELDGYSKAVAEQRDKLSGLLKEAKRASEETSTVAMTLDNEVAVLAEAALQSAEGTRVIGEAAEAQNLSLDTASEAIHSLLSSIAAVKVELEAEAASIERMNKNNESQFAGLKTVGDTIDSTAEFATQLDELTKTSSEAMARLSLSMDRVRSSSKEIRVVVDAVNDFADRTTLLAMNASIEAAHAGAAGRGFAVIANEIKQLAQANSERSKSIATIVSGIEESVDDVVLASSSVKNSLAGISDGAAKTKALVLEAASESSRQREAGLGISNESLALAVSAIKMSDEASRQSDLSNAVSIGMNELRMSQKNVIESTSIIVERNAELASMSQALLSLASRAHKSALDLSRAMES